MVPFLIETPITYKTKGWPRAIIPRHLQIPEAPQQAMTFMEVLPEVEHDVTGLGKYGAGDYLSYGWILGIGKNASVLLLPASPCRKVLGGYGH